MCRVRTTPVWSWDCLTPAHLNSQRPGSSPDESHSCPVPACVLVSLIMARFAAPQVLAAEPQKAHRASH